MKAAAAEPAALPLRLAAGLLALAGVGHLLAVPHHADPGHGGALHGWAFAAVGAAQLAGAALLLRRPRPGRPATIGLVGSAALVVLWAVSRTVGLPYGPHPGEPEVIGVLDALTVMTQLGVVGLLARGHPRRGRSRVAAGSAAAAVVGVVLFGLAGLGVPLVEVPHDHAPTSERDQPSRTSGPACDAGDCDQVTSRSSIDGSDDPHGHAHDQAGAHAHP